MNNNDDNELPTEEDLARQRLIDELEEFTIEHPAQRRILALLTTAARIAEQCGNMTVMAAIVKASADVWMQLDPEKELRPWNAKSRSSRMQ
jgi:hypothetical protein